MAAWNSWTGFSDEDLQKLKSSAAAKRARNLGQANPNQPRKKVASNKQKRQITSSLQNITSEQKLVEDVTKIQQVAKEVSSKSNKPNESSEATNSQSIHTTNAETDEKQVNIISEERESEILYQDDDIREKELSKLEKFQQQQKVMEELNKKNKEKLMNALAERRARARRESTRLTYIQKELSHLDTLLSLDVKILRDRIEEACRDFLHAQKHYEKAEYEFIAAKIQLHKTTEIKEELTQHLYTIIHQNEVRKAQKLTELMNELELETSSDEFIQNVADLPSLSVVNPCQVVNLKHTFKIDEIVAKQETEETPLNLSGTAANNNITQELNLNSSVEKTVLEVQSKLESLSNTVVIIDSKEITGTEQLDSTTDIQGENLDESTIITQPNPLSE